MTCLLINIWFDLFKWNSSFTWGLLMLKYNIIAGTTVQHAWLKCHYKLNRMPLILIFTVHAKLQFTYVNTYPEDPPLIEVPSYEGMDDSEAENLREFLDQEVITCDWLSNKTWRIFWKSFIVSMFQGCLSFTWGKPELFQLEDQIDCFIPFGKLQ